MSKDKPAPSAKPASSTATTQRLQSTPTAGRCPKNEQHSNTRIYRTAGNIRYCKCNDCGHNWKQSSGDGDPLASFLNDLATSLEAAQRQDLEDGSKAIVLSDKDAKEIAVRLRSFITS